jgi:hypothetical protein
MRLSKYIFGIIYFQLQEYFGDFFLIFKSNQIKSNFNGISFSSCWYTKKALNRIYTKLKNNKTVIKLYSLSFCLNLLKHVSDLISIGSEFHNSTPFPKTEFFKKFFRQTGGLMKNGSFPCRLLVLSVLYLNNFQIKELIER